MEFSACKQFLFCKKMLSKYRIFKLKMLIQVKKKKMMQHLYEDFSKLQPSKKRVKKKRCSSFKLKTLFKIATA